MDLERKWERLFFSLFSNENGNRKNQEIKKILRALEKIEEMFLLKFRLCGSELNNTRKATSRQKLPEPTQIHVHWVGDAIQPFHPLSSPSLPALNLSQHQGLFKWVSSAHQVAKCGISVSTSVLPMNIQDWSPLGWTGWIFLTLTEHQLRGKCRIIRFWCFIPFNGYHNTVR